MNRHVVFLMAGLSATAAQVLLLRELVVDVAGDEASIGVGLAAWLVGIALGAALARRRSARASDLDAGAGLAGLSIVSAWAIVAGRFLSQALAPAEGELPGLAPTLGLAALGLLPAGTIVGWTFTALASSAARTWRGGEAIARLYVFEALGSLAGGLAATLAIGHVSPLRLAAWIGAATALSVPAAARSGLVGRPATAAVAALLCVLTSLAAGPIDRFSERARFASAAPGIPFFASVDTPYEHVALGGGEVRHLYAAGQYVASFPDPYSAETLGHLLALLSPRPREVLVLGGVERGLLPVLLRHGVVRLTLVEPDAAALAFLRPQLAEGDRRALEDARVRIVHDDPRAFLARAGPTRFDLVLLLGPEPTTLLRARLATVEFYRLVASRLSADGVLVASLPAVPAVLAAQTEALAGTVVASLQQALPVVSISLSTESFAVAGWRPEAVTLDPRRLAARWEARRLHSPSFDAAILPLLLPPERVAAQQASVERAALRAVASRDDRPISFLHALARRQRLVSGGGERLVRSASSLPPLLLAALAFAPALFLAARRLGAVATPAREGSIASHAVAVTGTAGLGWSLLVLFSFQTHSGVLYGRLGALIAVFMLGLALGGAAAARCWNRGVFGPAGEAAGLRALRSALALAALVALALPFGLRAAAALGSLGPTAALLFHAALLLAAGAATGGVFPLAAELRLARGEGVAEAAGRLETADHAGAAVAALVGAVVYVPLLGLERSAFLIAALLAAALALTLATAKLTGWHPSRIG